MEYDIFISYRRKGGFDTAKHLYDLLVHDGYKVSFDIDSLRNGDFDEHLLEYVKQCKDFIIVLDENAFARTLDPSFDPKKDWLRQELACALENNKNVIPIMLYGFDDFPDNLPDDIAGVAKKNGPKYSHDYFDEFYRKLKKNFLVTGNDTGYNAASIRFGTDLDCRILRYKEELAVVKSGGYASIRLPKGKHELTFEGLECKDDSYSMIYEVKEIDYEDFIKIELLDKYKARKEKENEIKEKKRREAEEQKRLAEERERQRQQEIDKERRKNRWRKLSDKILNKYSAIFLLLLISVALIVSIWNDNKMIKSDVVVIKNDEHEETIPSTSEQTITVNGVSFKMIKVEGGTFNMGAQKEYPDRINYDSDAYDDEEPVHSVTLSDYYIGETEVTQELWQAVMGSNPSYFRGSQKPVENVSWNGCDDFIKKLNVLTGKNFRLPTEAEWEYAARGGNKSKGYKYSGSDTIGNVAWYDDNSGDQTHDVKTKSPNELGIYDMSGNVLEWCQDWYGDYNSGSQTNPKGPSSGSSRVLRGGSWIYSARLCRVSHRFIFNPVISYSNIGLRLVLQ